MRQLGDLQLDITGLRRQQSVSDDRCVHCCGSRCVRSGRRRSCSVASSSISSCITRRTASRIRFDSIAGTERVEKFGQGRLIQSHRCVLLRWVLAEHTKNHADGSPNSGPTENPPRRGTHTACEVAQPCSSLPVWVHRWVHGRQLEHTTRTAGDSIGAARVDPGPVSAGTVFFRRPSPDGERTRRAGGVQRRPSIQERLVGTAPYRSLFVSRAWFGARTIEVVAVRE